MATSFEILEDYASKMVKVFKENSKIVSVSDGVTQQDVSYTSDKGMSDLGDIFETVPIQLRSAVFSMFLDKLEHLGIFYDIDQFKGSVH